MHKTTIARNCKTENPQTAKSSEIIRTINNTKILCH